MADVLIRGLQLPKAGQQLVFSEGITGKIYARLYPTPDITDYEKDCWHEVIAVPDHERLIDADALKADGYTLARLQIDFDDDGMPRSWRELIDIDNAPTVIPASK